MSHNHHHHGPVKGRPLAIAIFLNLSITIAQVVGGLISGSLALLGDAVHNFSDVLSLILSYFANKLSGRNQTENRTFGYKRAQILAAFINALSLIFVSGYLIYEAINRLLNVQPILSSYVIWLAVLGIVVNGGSVLLLAKVRHNDSNMKGAYLHLMADLATSVAVLLGGVAMYFFEIYWLDSALTIAMGVYLIYLSAKLFMHTVGVLMQFVPRHLNVKEVCARLCKEPGVRAIHHVHIWPLDDEMVHFEAHLLLEEDMQIHDFEKIRENLEQILSEEFNIHHSIFQPEISGNPDAELVFPQE